MRPKSRAVFSHAPAFSLETALRGGGLQGELGDALRALFLRVELGEVPANDLLGGVTLESFGAGVPARYDPVGVEHVDGIIRDRVDQQPVAAIIACGSLQAIFKIHRALWLDRGGG